MSPWFHLGQISVQRAVLHVKKHGKGSSEDKNGFIEEAVVRSELSDNFCFYNPNYDSIEGGSDWAKKTLQDHAKDKREYVYTEKVKYLTRTTFELSDTNIGNLARSFCLKIKCFHLYCY